MNKYLKKVLIGEKSKMRAAIIQDFGKVDIVDVPKPSPEPGEALIKISTAGVCHTDLHIAMGDWVEDRTEAQAQLPFPLGHEGIGIVEELGQELEADIKIGDRVILGLGSTGGHWCETCEYCLAGESMHCPERTPLFGIFSEYISVWAKSLVKIPDDLTHDVVKRLLILTEDKNTYVKGFAAYALGNLKETMHDDLTNVVIKKLSLLKDDAESCQVRDVKERFTKVSNIANQSIEKLKQK